MTSRTLNRRQLLAGSSLSALSALTLTACGIANAKSGSDGKTIKIIVTESAPFQEPTKIAQKLLADQGWTLEPTYVTDIIQPNVEVSQGVYDANFFQHGAYLQQFNQDKGLDLIPLFYGYSSPAGLWSAKYNSVEDLPKGAEIALPVDTANVGRGLVLLHIAGAITVNTDKPVTHISQADITSNPKEFKFVEVDQQSLAQTYPDVDAGFLFVRLAAEIGLTVEDAIAFEDREEDILPYTCLVASRKDFAGTEKAKALQKAYQSDEVRDWFANYIGGVLDTPWDRDPIADLEIWNTQ